MKNYEEKYNNAVRQIKELLKKGKENGWSILAYEKDFEEIFPELAESEDEKIKKVLTDYFKKYKEKGDYCKTFFGTPTDNILAWLEKQGQVKDLPKSQHENKTREEKKENLTEEEPVDDEDAAYSDAIQKGWEELGDDGTLLSRKSVYNVGFYDGYKFGKKSK